MLKILLFVLKSTEKSLLIMLWLVLEEFQKDCLYTQLRTCCRILCCYVGSTYAEIKSTLIVQIKLVFLTCGCCHSGATSIEKYELRTNMWTPVANMNGRRLQFGVAVLDDKLYVVGGRDGLKTLNTVECYNPRTKTWSVKPPMSTHRHGLGM